MKIGQSREFYRVDLLAKIRKQTFESNYRNKTHFSLPAAAETLGTKAIFSLVIFGVSGLVFKKWMDESIRRLLFASTGN